MADRSTSNWTNLLNNSMELEDTVTLGSKVGVMAKPVSREDTKSNNDPTAGLTDILIKILGSFSGDVKDLEETKVNSRDVADEVYSKYDILEPIEDPAKARRIGGLTTKNLPMPVNAPVGRQRFSIFPEAAEEVAEEVVEDKVVDDGLMSDPRKLGGSEGYGSLGKPEKDVEAVADIGDGLMSRRDGSFNPIEMAIKEKTSQFYLNIGKKAEGDHGSTPVPTKDARETKPTINGLPNPNYIADKDDRSKDVGFGHKVKDSEDALGEIHGIKFKNDDGTYITLTEEQKVSILNSDMKAELELARSSGWDDKLKKLGISWEDLDYKYQNALTSLAYNTGGGKAGRGWTKVLKAAKNKDPDAFAREMRRKDAGNNTRGMDNRVIKELFYSGIIENRSQVSSELPLANASSEVAN